MEVFGTLLTFALVIVGFLLFMGLVVCAVMAVMARREINRTAKETKAKVLGYLPCENCGECGYKSCEDYANAAVQGTIDYVPCPKCSEDLNARISLMWANPKKKAEQEEEK